MGSLLAKPDTAKHTEDGAGSTGRFAYGVSAMQGWRRAMEDAHLALPDFDVERQLGLFGVFDGHGGSAVARVVAETLPETLRKLPAFKEGRYDEALRETFLLVDAFLDSPAGRQRVAELSKDAPEEPSEDEEEVVKQMIASGELTLSDLEGEGEEEEEDGEEKDPDFDPQEDEDEEMEGEGEEEEEGKQEKGANGTPGSDWATGEGPDGMGTTAVVALVCGGPVPEVICANAGDSRCVLARGARALNMSRDHKPTLRSERERIKKAGGFVTGEGRVDGNLNLSRALGDFVYKKDKRLKPEEQKISCEAEVRRKPLTEADQYLLLGCDGIFEKATSQALVDFVLPKLQGRRRRPPAPLSSACSAFLDVNIAKVPSKEEGLGCDNMTLMVVQLRAGAAVPPNGAHTALPSRPLAGRPSLRRAALLPFGGRSVASPRRTIDKGRPQPGLLGRRRLAFLAQRKWAAQRAAAAAAAAAATGGAGA